MPFTSQWAQTTTGIQVFSQVNKCTLSYRFLYGNVEGCVFAKNRPVSLNWTDYIEKVSVFRQGWSILKDTNSAVIVTR